MKISKRLIRKLIKESIEDFAKADFVAGTEVDQTAIPRQIFDNIKAWMDNPANHKLIEKLKDFKEAIDTNPSTRYHTSGDGKRAEMLNQYDALAAGISADTMPGGMKGSEIDRMQKRYIAFLGDQLVQQHPKLREYIRSVRSKENYLVRKDINHLDVLFQTLFDQIDEIGIGPVTYSDYAKIKEDLRYFQTGTPYYRSSRYSSSDPVMQGLYSGSGDISGPIFRKDGKYAQHEWHGQPRIEFDNKDYAITSKFNSQNTNITDGLGLYEINIAYNQNSHYQEDYTDYDYDKFAEYVMEEVYSVPGIITGLDSITDQNGTRIKFFVIATNADIDTIYTNLDDKLISVDGVGPDNHTAELILDVEELKTIIQPNSMDSIKDFLEPHGAGIPTHSNSAQGIKREHETFLQSSLNSALSMMGSFQFADDAEENAAAEKLDLIYTVLELKGHDIQGI